MTATMLDVEPLPLKKYPDDVIRVGETRVTLDTVVFAFNEGASAEEIVCRYPSLDLGDVYAAISYYLKHKDSIDLYIHEREAHAADVRGENEKRFNAYGVRERLLARRQRTTESFS